MYKGNNQMKLLIVGATGGVGRQLVEQALEQGQMVTAFVRAITQFRDYQVYYSTVTE